MASVVLRQRMATSLSGRPANRSAAARSCSWPVVYRRDLKTAPRCTLEYQGRHSWTWAATWGRAPVDAAASKLRYGRSTPSTHGTRTSSPTRDVITCASSLTALDAETVQLELRL